MKEKSIKILLVVGILFVMFIYFNYDKVSSDETLSIDNISVKTEELGYVRLIDGNLDYNINFDKVGQEFIFSFDIKNDTLFDMNINNINITGVSDWMSYRIYDTEGHDIIGNRVLKKNNKQKVYVALKYTKNIADFADKTCNMGISMKVTRV